MSGYLLLTLPFRPDPALSKPDELGPGIAVDASASMPYQYGFGINETNPTQIALDETFEFLEVVESLNIQLMNITLGSPYYNPTSRALPCIHRLMATNHLRTH